MKRDKTNKQSIEKRRWMHFYSAMLLTVIVLACATVVWFRSTRLSSEKTVNDLVKFYLTEIAERNCGAINFELEERMEQLERIEDVLKQDDLKSEQNIRDFVEVVQQMNGLDIFALVDKQGMVYTKDSTFLGSTQYDFMSKPITQLSVNVENSYENKVMLIIASPISSPAGAKIPVASCFLGVNIDNFISTMELNGVRNKTVCRLFSTSGENLLNVSKDYPNSRNLFDVWEEKAHFAAGYSLDAIRKDWEKGLEGYAVYSVEEGGSTYVYYSPIAHTGLYFTVVMRENDVNEIVTAGTRRLRSFSFWYCLVVAVFLCGLLLMAIMMSRREEKSRIERDQLKIVGALSSDYVDVYLADIENDLTTSIKSYGKMIDPKKRTTNSYRKVWKNFVDCFVLEEDAQWLLDAVSPDTLSAQMSGLSEYEVDFRLKREDGIHYCHAKFVRMDSGEDRFIAGLRNDDARVHAEQERQKELQDALVAARHANHAKTVFLNNMSHDMRTPMNAIIGFTNIAFKHQPNPQIRDCLEKIRESSEHLLTLINDVLDISRIESGKVQYTPVPVNLSTVTDVVLGIMNGFLLNRDLTFHVSRAKPENCYVLTDAVRIREILVNILSNAVKFTDDGGIVCFETAYCPGSDDGQIVVRYRISDNGVGMSEEFVKHIFDVFSQEENDARTQYKGSGLGMAITKQYVDLLGGTIKVESKKGSGSTFTVEFPMQLTDAQNDASQKKTQSILNLHGIRVLLAEDNELNAEIAEIQLTERGMQVTRAADGKQVVKLFADSPAGTFDVILMDIMMPGQNGYEATREIRSLENRPDSASIPIIALTANAFAADVQASLEAGMNGHLSKPIVIDEVVETIARNLKK